MAGGWKQTPGRWRAADRTGKFAQHCAELLDPRQTAMREADPDPSELGAPPADLLETWMHAVRRMDRDTLDLFVRRTWRAWDATSLRPVQAAVDARRGELDGE
jgi:hypothetical protein